MSLLRVLSVWVLLALAMSANGVLREAILEPALGARSADVLSAALGVALILLVTAFGFRPLAGAPTRRLVAASLLLVAITVTFEVALGRFVEHRTWAELLGDYAIWRGQLWPVVLLTLAITPFLWGRSAAAAPGAKPG